MGAFNDNYYYQLVDNIRKFKGTRPATVYHKTNKIRIDGNFADWKDIEAVFTDDKGDIFHRKHAGWGRISEYVNTTGRNDIVESRISSDQKNVYFYVKTASSLTAWTDKDWMQLYITVRGNTESGWEGFQFVVNGEAKSSRATTLQEYKDGKWATIKSVRMNSQGNELEIAIPKKSLGIKGGEFTLDFKWADNSPALENVMNWLDKGDTAPNARFGYRYIKQ
jgi:hypothetical protein